jgi:hypothetical protein
MKTSTSETSNVLEEKGGLSDAKALRTVTGIDMRTYFLSLK